MGISSRYLLLTAGLWRGYVLYWVLIWLSMSCIFHVISCWLAARSYLRWFLIVTNDLTDEGLTPTWLTDWLFPSCRGKKTFRHLDIYQNSSTRKLLCSHFIMMLTVLHPASFLNLRPLIHRSPPSFLPVHCPLSLSAQLPLPPVLIKSSPLNCHVPPKLKTMNRFESYKCTNSLSFHCIAEVEYVLSGLHS